MMFPVYLELSARILGRSTVWNVLPAFHVKLMVLNCQLLVHRGSIEQVTHRSRACLAPKANGRGKQLSPVEISVNLVRLEWFAR
eukprot:749635-Hanusia_phi.AAC.2